MAHKKSAKKRLRQNVKRRFLNKSRLSTLRTHIKRFLRMILVGDAAGAEAMLPVVTKLLYRGAKAGVIHQKKAARTVSRLTKKVNDLKASKQPAA